MTLYLTLNCSSALAQEHSSSATEFSTISGRRHKSEAGGTDRKWRRKCLKTLDCDSALAPGFRRAFGPGAAEKAQLPTPLTSRAR